MKNYSYLRLFLVFIVFISIILITTITKAADLTILVDTTLDSNAVQYQDCTSVPNDCSLRGAISKANADSDPVKTYTIRIPAGIYTLSLDGRDEDANAIGDLDIGVSLVLEGEGIDQTIIQAGLSPAEGIDRVLDIQSENDIDVYISGLTVRHGKLPVEKFGAGIQMGDLTVSLYLDHVVLRDNLGERLEGEEGLILGGGIFVYGDFHAIDCQITGNQVDGDGGGIYQSQYGIVSLERVLISGNSAEQGGGFSNGNVAKLTNVTISGNSAELRGGGISQWNKGNLEMHYTTIAENVIQESIDGSAIYTSAQWVIKSYNSIIAGEAGKKTCSNSMTDGHHNISNDASCGTGFLVVDPKLLPLADYGGDTMTHALAFNSPAIDAAGDGDGAILCPAQDQRLTTRPFDGDGNGIASCDIGSFERVSYWLYVPMILKSK